MRIGTNRFKYQVMHVLAGKILVLAISFLSSVYFSRILMASGKGEMAVVTSISGIFVQFCNFGMHSANTYSISKNKETQAKAEGNIIICFFISLLVALVAFPIMASYISLLKISHILIAISLLSFVFNLFLLLQENLFLAIGNVRTFNSLQIIGTVLAFIFVFFASLFVKINAFYVVLFMLIGQIITAGISLLNKTYVRPEISVAFFKELLPYGLKSYLASFVTYLLLRTDLLMLNYYLPPKEVGEYSLAVNLSDIVFMISVAVSTVLFPKLSGLASLREKVGVLKKVIKFMLPITLIFAVAMELVADIIIPFVYGEDYRGSVPLLRVLLIAGVTWGTIGFASNFFASINRFSATIIIPLIGFGINVIMNYILIPKIRAMGAAIASDVSYLFVAIFMYLCLIIHVKKHAST